MTKVKAVITGTPFECGAGVFEELVIPCLKALNGKSERERKQFYSGLLVSCMGAMTADFTHAGAVDLVETLLHSFREMSVDLPPTEQLKH